MTQFLLFFIQKSVGYMLKMTVMNDFDKSRRFGTPGNQNPVFREMSVCRGFPNGVCEHSV